MFSQENVIVKLYYTKTREGFITQSSVEDTYVREHLKRALQQKEVVSFYIQINFDMSYTI